MSWLKGRHDWIAMLMKTAVARKILRQRWTWGVPVGRAAIFAMDAMHHFGAAVNACLLVLPVQPSQPSRSCDLFDRLEALEPTGTVGYYDGGADIGDLDGSRIALFKVHIRGDDGLALITDWTMTVS